MQQDEQEGGDLAEARAQALARIEAALARGEVAADRLGRRHAGLRESARETVARLDRLIETEGRKTDG